jgi:hypothetical protein
MTGATEVSELLALKTSATVDAIKEHLPHQLVTSFVLL